jgi:hypothetical protein
MTAQRLLSLLMDLRPRQARRWSKFRSRGRRWFILVDGLLGFGGVMAGLSVIGIYFLHHHYDATTGFPVAASPPDLIYRVVLPVVGIAFLDGLVVGIAMWYYMEWAYRRYQKQEAGRA